MEKRLLITGFDPFGGASANPSWQAAQAMPDRVGEYALFKLQLPTVFSQAGEQVLAKAREISPDVILCIGLAGGRSAVTPERIAVNIRDARIPDNAGNQPQGEFVAPQGPAAYFATVPVEAMAQAIRSRGIPAAVSNSAGAFVCNDVMYTILHSYAGTNTRCGFLHVPNTPDLGTPSLPLEQITQALKAAIEAL